MGLQAEIWAWRLGEGGTKEEEKRNKSSKDRTWSAVPVAPMWVYVDVRWLEGQRRRRGR